jgi:purine-binding chemotaxis protein CheW
MSESMQQTSAAGSGARQFLTFTLGNEEFGFDLLKVQEIRGYTAVTPIPNSPRHVRGVMNLRGAVVPVIGLREKFGMETVDYDRFTVIVVVSVGNKVMGLVVDAVSDVLSVPADAIEPPPDLGRETDTSFITGLARTAARLLILVDIEQMLGAAGPGSLPGGPGRNAR